jgi:cobyrinic acid a,c-diamide synthase
LNGFRDFDKDLDIAGVILNNVSGDQHERKLTEAMERYTDINVLGMIRKDPTKVLEQRYLGLRTVNQSEKASLGPLKDLTSDIGLDSLIEVADRTDDIILDDSVPYEVADGKGLRVAVPRDDAFCFYYHDNIECMKASGIEVTEFSPLAGDGLPDADICYLGGGYPELFAEKISDNKDFIQGLKKMSDDGRRVVGECGGLMTMCSSIVDSSGKSHEMAGIFDAEAVMTGKRHGPSYVVAESSEGRKVKGHEYHYSDVYVTKDYAFEYKVTRGMGIDGKRDGMRINRCIGSYMHQHVLSAESWIDSLIDRS